MLLNALSLRLAVTAVRLLLGRGEPALLVPGRYDPWLRLNLSGEPKSGICRLLAGGVSVGAGIGAMHCFGMLATQMNVGRGFDRWRFWLSIVP